MFEIICTQFHRSHCYFTKSVVQVPGKTDMIKTKGISCCVLSHYLCVADLWGILSNERQYLNMNSDWKFALSIFLRNQRSHNALYRCSMAIVQQLLDGGILCYSLCERISVSSDSLFQLWVCVFVCISIDANTCQISIWVKNWLQLIGNRYKLPNFFIFFIFSFNAAFGASTKV